MFCPYACNVKTINQWQYDYDDEGRQIAVTHVQSDKRKYVKCLREECAVFNRETNKCEYKE